MLYFVVIKATKIPINIYENIIKRKKKTPLACLSYSQSSSSSEVTIADHALHDKILNFHHLISEFDFKFLFSIVVLRHEILNFSLIFITNRAMIYCHEIVVLNNFYDGNSNDHRAVLKFWLPLLCLSVLKF